MRSYRASALGSCTRAQIALQLGKTALATSDKMQALYDRGNDHEVECLAAMEAEGWNFRSTMYPPEDLAVHDNQFYVELEVAGAVITGHLDGIAHHNRNYRHLAGDCVVEIKSPQSWAKWERAHKTGDYSDPLMNRYAWQISVYMVATGLEAVVACVEDGQVRTFGIEVPPFSLEHIKGRVSAMEAAVAAGHDPAQMTCSQADYPCPVAYLHDPKEVVKDEALDFLIGQYETYKDERDTWDAKVKETRDAIDAHLGILNTLTTAAGTATRVPDSEITDWKGSYEALCVLTDMQLPDTIKTKRAGYINVTPKVDPDPLPE